MSDHLPVLQVVLPLIAAPLCLLLRQPRLVRLFAAAVAWACLLVAGLLLQQVRAGGRISYELGGWAPPWGIEYRVDTLSAYVLVVVAAIAAIVLTAGLSGERPDLAAGRSDAFCAAFLLALAGLLGITITGDAFNIFVFLEISALASYVLVSLGKGRRALWAAFSYLIMGTLGGTFFLLGVGFLYQVTGTLNLADLASRIQAHEDSRTVMVAFALLVVGISLKLAVFPLHQWLPDAYAHAPSMVSGFLAATGTKVSYYVLIRLVFGVFGAAFVFGTLRLTLILLPLSLAAMFIGSLAAIYQTDLKRLLAYSSVAQIGYLTLALSFGSVAGVAAGLVHLFNHALMKGGLFLAAACIVERTGSTALADLRGLGRRMPWTSAALVVGGLGLIGVPATAGFVSKWVLVEAALVEGWHGIAFMILLSSLLAAVYVWRVVEVAYFREPPSDEPTGEAPFGLLVPTWVLIGATVAFGVATRLTVGVANRAAEQLVGGGG